MVPEWTTSERQSPDGAVESEQQLAAPRAAVSADEEGAETLGRVYWETLERFTRSAVTVRRRASGAIELRLPFGPALLRFAPPELRASEGGVACRYPIEGGLLARRRGGALTFRQKGRPDGVVLSSAISGFYPALGARPGRADWTGALYARGQARIHVALSRRYFARLLESR